MDLTRFTMRIRREGEDGTNLRYTFRLAVGQDYRIKRLTASSCNASSKRRSSSGTLRRRYQIAFRHSPITVKLRKLRIWIAIPEFASIVRDRKVRVLVDVVDASPRTIFTDGGYLCVAS